MLVLSVSKWFLFMLSALPLASAPPGDEAARILTTQCKSCHDGSLRPAFDLTSPQVRATMLKAIHGGGPGVKAMPPGRKLKPEHLASLSAWIERGAPLPGPHWAFTPLAPLTPGQSIDSLIDANLHARGIPAAPPAGARTLPRRRSFDLPGRGRIGGGAGLSAPVR
ncbi:MAG: c-type cytochrome, partial [Acidobacteriota bacterium]